MIAATHGRSLWELDLPQLDNETPREITQNTTWGAGTFDTLNTDLVIRSGATLTVGILGCETGNELLSRGLVIR